MSETYTHISGRRQARIRPTNWSGSQRRFCVETETTVRKRNGVRVTKTSARYFAGAAAARVYAEGFVTA